MPCLLVWNAYQCPILVSNHQPSTLTTFMVFCLCLWLVLISIRYDHLEYNVCAYICRWLERESCDDYASSDCWLQSDISKLHREKVIICMSLYLFDYVELLCSGQFRIPRLRSFGRYHSRLLCTVILRTSDIISAYWSVKYIYGFSSEDVNSGSVLSMT